LRIIAEETQETDAWN